MQNTKGVRVGDKMFKHVPTGEDKSREKLKNLIKDKVIHTGGRSVLDLAEVAIGNKESYNRFRAKSLRILNNLVREIQSEIDAHYTVDYDSRMESVVQFGKGEGENGK